ncbi:uncharacterized protein LOC143144938 [Ptiloglossa arizonensis]|uniref:uncharacterized protein LOC143144938 n=1 Tax=Ptiloglossa arizonensis TaxID=3350558 RepID=UPI003FA0C6AB
MEKGKTVYEISREKKEEFKNKLKQLAECDEVVSSETMNAIGRVTEFVRGADDNAPSSDELDKDLEGQYNDLNFFLELPHDTYSLTRIRPELPVCIKYGVRSGLTHINMTKFSPLSRGHQAGATAIAAFATTMVYKSRCWNEKVIDQIIDDGDTFYCESYKKVNTDDRRMLSILDLQRTLCVQNKLTVNISIEDAAYAGTFRSNEPKELHLLKALDLFFKRKNAGILCSSVLHVAIWKETKYYSIFDGQARKENCEPASDGVSGTAKLFHVRDLIGVLFVILEKSNVQNEPFVIYAIAISGVDHYTQPIDTNVTESFYSKPSRRPSGYKVQEKYRAVVQGSYHIMHPLVPQLLRGRTHMVIAISALIYSRLVNANKWTTALVDLIFNQANIYFVDLVRVLGKDLKNENFELKLEEAMGDVILGVYSAKVKIRANVVPGHGQMRGKFTMDSGIREFFQSQSCGLLELKGIYYAIWKHDDTYYYMDPYACDDEGFRSDTAELDGTEKKGESACVTMNSSINQVLETVLENTQSRERDAFMIHGVRVLYVKTGTTADGPLEKVIYREKGTSRRPQAPITEPFVKEFGDRDEQAINMKPTMRPEMDKLRDAEVQAPSPMRDADSYMMKEDEPETYVVLPPDEDRETEELLDEEEVVGATPLTKFDQDEEEFTVNEEDLTEKGLIEEPILNIVRGYRLINPQRLVVRGTKNCLDDGFKIESRGKQGLIAALAVLAYRRLKDPKEWRNVDIDQLVDISDRTYGDVIAWIRQGSPAIIEKKEILGETRAKVIQGEANPLANLAEALECYFNRYSELVLENKRLMYGIWKEGANYFVFNPYGSDEEGWRVRDYPASFAVTGSLNELIDLLYGTIEFNDPGFVVHFAALSSIQPGKFAVQSEIKVPDEATVEQFKTRFLPITDDDLERLKEETKEPEKPKETEKDELDAMDIGEEEEEEEEDVEEEVEEEGRGARYGMEEEVEKPIIDPLLEIGEQDQPDSPYRLNLVLLTAGLKIPKQNVEDMQHVHEQVTLEKLKYNHPPPYVMPSNKTLLKLLVAKKAKRSVPSLVSRFTIDSALDVKKKGGFPVTMMGKSAVTMPDIEEEVKPSKKIKLSPKSYLFSRLLPICLMPLRAINDLYIQHEDTNKALEEAEAAERATKIRDFVHDDVPEVPIGVRIRPVLIPLGPVIRTPVREKRVITCFEKKKRKCMLAKGDMGDSFTEKLLCNTENLLLELFFPDFKAKDQAVKVETFGLRGNNERNKMMKSVNNDILKNIMLYESIITPKIDKEEKSMDSRSKSLNKELVDSELTTIRRRVSSRKKKYPDESVGLKVTDDGIGILQGNLCLENRAENEANHFKSCFFSALLCILAKIKLDPDRFRASTLDQFIFLGDKIYQRTGKLRYKPYRWFHRVEILNTTYNVIVKQDTYADPENTSDDDLDPIMNSFLEKNQTGIIVFSNCSYGFWTTDKRYYLFDPYPCDEQGIASEEGYSCLMGFCDLNSMMKRIELNVGENTRKPYRLYTICIAQMESRKRKKKRKKKIVRCEEIKEQEDRVDEPPEMELSTVSSMSLIELPDWVNSGSRTSLVYDMTIPGFAPIEHYDASMLDVIVLENEITVPVQAPFKKLRTELTDDMDESEAVKLLVRKKTFDRRFKAHAAVTSPLDICIIAWSLIHDPITWSVRTVRGLFEAALDYTFDSILAAEDSTVSEMTDGLLPEFEIANYIFRAVFVPLHYGTLYAVEGWNLSMSLQKIFETSSYTGAILVCSEVHIGVTKKDANYFAWWIVRGTKNLRIVTSTNLTEFLKLIVRELEQPEEVIFTIRVITVSYAQKVDPDCSDTRGLHEPVVPCTSLAEIHRMATEPYDLEAIFRPTLPDIKPIFVRGTVALSNRDTLTEPRAKRCYFVAILVVMVKRDIVQSPMPGMIDKILEVAESVYREFQEPKFHTEHILRNVTVMNRIFDLRVCASPLITITMNPRTQRNDFYVQVKKHLKRFFRTYESGIIHFTNCCYGFWYSRGTNAYYYLDPYQCNEKGKKVSNEGKACLCIFSTICQMVKHMCINQFEDTSGFFVHRLNVASINVPPFKTFKEDPMWLYLDYHWNFKHAPDIVKLNNKKKKTSQEEGEREIMKLFWNNYAVEVSTLIYSAWGTIGSFDSRFGDRAGKNQAAICVAVLAMQYLSHPSRWGPAILDSAVICGDSYYTESLRSATLKCTKHSNRYNLQPCFKIFPHLWTIHFKEDICGILYGARNRLTLATALNHAFQNSPNLIIECDKLHLAALSAKDGFYVADPCWVGPPLFDRDHGAIYVLRCRNMNCLVYTVVKMLNTNQRLDFRLTPIAFTFEQEDMNFVDNETPKIKKQVLLEPIGTVPGKTEDPGPPIIGALTSPNVASYLVYNKNLALGITKGHELENPEITHTAPVLEGDIKTSVLVSTTWRLNKGQAAPLEKVEPVFDPTVLQPDPEHREYHSFKPYKSVPMSITDLLAACDDYPRVVDFKSETPVTRPLECAAASNFLAETARQEFRARTADMRQDSYKTYKHRLPKHKPVETVHTIAEEVTTDGEEVRYNSPETEKEDDTEDEKVIKTEVTSDDD